MDRPTFQLSPEAVNRGRKRLKDKRARNKAIIAESSTNSQPSPTHTPLFKLSHRPSASAPVSPLYVHPTATSGLQSPQTILRSLEVQNPLLTQLRRYKTKQNLNQLTSSDQNDPAAPLFNDDEDDEEEEIPLGTATFVESEVATESEAVDEDAAAATVSSPEKLSEIEKNLRQSEDKSDRQWRQEIIRRQQYCLIMILLVWLTSMITQTNNLISTASETITNVTILLTVIIICNSHARADVTSREQIYLQFGESVKKLAKERAGLFENCPLEIKNSKPFQIREFVTWRPSAEFEDRAGLRSLFSSDVHNFFSHLNVDVFGALPQDIQFHSRFAYVEFYMTCLDCKLVPKGIWNEQIRMDSDEL
ncbi:unnamed protein product, partial [Oikopleura dioica]